MPTREYPKGMPDAIAAHGETAGHEVKANQNSEIGRMMALSIICGRRASGGVCSPRACASFVLRW